MKRPDPGAQVVDDELDPEPIDLPGATLRVPTGWRCDRQVAPYVLVAFEPRDDAFAANLTVVREAPGDGDPLSTPARVEGYLDALAQGLHGFHLIDAEAEVIAGGPGLRLLFLHHTTDRGLACEQWVRPDEAGTTIVSLTCLALDRDHYGPLFAAVAASWSDADG